MAWKLIISPLARVAILSGMSTILWQYLCMNSSLDCCLHASSVSQPSCLVIAETLLFLSSHPSQSAQHDVVTSQPGSSIVDSLHQLGPRLWMHIPQEFFIQQYSKVFICHPLYPIFDHAYSNLLLSDFVNLCPVCK